MANAIVIGGGPAGLMAAETLAGRGLSALVVDQMPTVARKFLMAGKSGLNLTKSEPDRTFLAAYREGTPWIGPMLDRFGAADVMDWAEGLEQPLFEGSTGRIFPKAMKASPLLRAWLARLDTLGVERRTRWRWIGWDGEALVFDTPDGRRDVKADVTVLALGGASWGRLGSDGKWADLLAGVGVPLTPFAGSNVGISLEWSEHMARHFGAPVKAIAMRCGEARSRGEVVISARGVEGGGLYPLSPGLREGAPLVFDLVPDLTQAQVAKRLQGKRGKASLSTFLRKALKLEGAKLALLNECGRPLPQGEALAGLIKALPIPYAGLRPIDEAISTVGGIPQDAVDHRLMLKALPGVFACGEMLDWDAPTGGYLLTACLSTGAWAGAAAADYTLRARR